MEHMQKNFLLIHLVYKIEKIERMDRFSTSVVILYIDVNLMFNI